MLTILAAIGLFFIITLVYRKGRKDGIKEAIDYFLIEMKSKEIDHEIVAEYKGMIAAARRAVALGARTVEFRVDSELVQRQVTGRYRVKAPHLKPLLAEVMAVLGRIPEWRVVHVPRSANREADAMANRALDARGVVT